MKKMHSVFKFVFLYFFTLSRLQRVLCLNGFVRFRRIEALDGQTCPEEHADTERNISSRTKCLILCAEKSSSRGVFLEPDTHRCITCSTDKMNTSTSTQSTFYKLQADEASVEPYRFVAEKLSWEDAKQNCIELGGYLTSIKSSEEQVRLENFIRLNTKFGVWVGGKGVDGDASSFKWLDGSYFSSGYENWYGAEPSNIAGKECIKLGKQVNFQWKAKSCADVYPSVCKLE